MSKKDNSLAALSRDDVQKLLTAREALNTILAHKSVKRKSTKGLRDLADEIREHGLDNVDIEDGEMAYILDMHAELVDLCQKAST